MIFRRLMMLPRFCFAEAAQSVEGTRRCMQDISHLPSLTLLQEGTQDHCSRQHRKVAVCRTLLKIWLICVVCLKNLLHSDKLSRTRLSAGSNKSRFSIPLDPPTTTKSLSTSSTPSSKQAGTPFPTQTPRTRKKHWHLPWLLQNPQQRRGHPSDFSCEVGERGKRSSNRGLKDKQARNPIQSHLRGWPCHYGRAPDLCRFIISGLFSAFPNVETQVRA